MAFRDGYLTSLCRAMRWLAAAVAIVAASARAEAATTTRPFTGRPNIVLILADDMGFSDIGCYGGEIATPNLDRLASQGVRFRQFYNMARCCPTRAALLSGLYPHQAGVGFMCQDLGDPAYRGELNDRCVTIAEVLKQAGYATAMVGKWHLSNLSIGEENAASKDLLRFAVNGPISPSTNSWPCNRGFDDHVGTIAGVGSYFDPWSLLHNEQPITPPRDRPFYYTDFINDEGAKRIDAFADAAKPFFLYVAETAPHWPLHVNDPAAVARYEMIYSAGWDAIRARRLERLKQLGLVEEASLLSPRADYPRLNQGASRLCAWEDAPAKAWQARRMAVYAAMIERMDGGVGRILGALHRRGLDDNTLVMFLSDNGGCAENVKAEWYDVPNRTRDGRAIRVGNDPAVMPGEDTTFQSYGPAWANVSNTPFRRFKHWTEEGGISAPCIVRWPGHTGAAAGRVEKDAVGDVIDVMPTFLAAADANYPTTFHGKPITPVQGKSLLAAIAGQPFDRNDSLFWEHEGNRAVRLGQWKLVGPAAAAWQLYDIAADRVESNDLASREPARVAELARLYEQWAQRCGVRPWPLRPAKK